MEYFSECVPGSNGSDYLWVNSDRRGPPRQSRPHPPLTTLPFPPLHHPLHSFFITLSLPHLLHSHPHTASLRRYNCRTLEQRRLAILCITVLSLTEILKTQCPSTFTL